MEFKKELGNRAEKITALPNDLVVKKIKSGSLGITCNVRVVDNKYAEITHDLLEKIFMSRDDLECAYCPIKVDKEHAVVQCTITHYKDGGNAKSISKVGEATQGNLKGPIQWNIPVTMAYMRAFDRAMIRILDFPETVYSSLELGMTDYYEGQISRLEYQLKMVDEKLLRDALEIINSTEERLKNTPAAADNAETQKEEPDEYRPDEDTVLLLGNCRGMTYSAAKQTKKWPSFLTWIASVDYKSKDARVMEQAAYFKKLAKGEIKE